MTKTTRLKSGYYFDMFGFKNYTTTNSYGISTDGFLNHTKCEDMNFSSVDYSFMNLSNRDMYQKDMESYYDTIDVVQNILDRFKYTVCPLGLIMNILNIVAIANAPSRLTQHSKLIISLAVSDMCIVLPEILYIIISKTFEYDSISYNCYTVLAYFYFEPSVTLVSLFNIFALGIDHYIAIVKPMHYNRIVSNSRIRACVALIWIVSFIIVVTESIPEIINYYKNKDMETHFCTHMTWEYRYNPKIPYFLVIPELIVLIILYARIYVAYKKFVTRRQSFRPDNQHNNKAIVTTLLIIGTFMVGWVPYSIIFTVNSLSEKTFATKLRFDNAAFILWAIFAFIQLNSFCDALIYALRLEVVQQGYKTIFRKIFKIRRICFHQKSTQQECVRNGSGARSHQTQ